MVVGEKEWHGENDAIDPTGRENGSAGWRRGWRRTNGSVKTTRSTRPTATGRRFVEHSLSPPPASCWDARPLEVRGVPVLAQANHIESVPIKAGRPSSERSPTRRRLAAFIPIHS
uniref:Uncharacterized protein n=1 Tax=Plectus sambesii TaxID=2011161 RepID=A0A914XPN6_9BILA